MPNLTEDITQTYLKAKDSEGVNSFRWLDLAAAKANRGGREGITAFLRCVLTIDIAPELARRRDSLVLMLMKTHGVNFIHASLRMKDELKPKLNTYIQKIKAEIKAKK